MMNATPQTTVTPSPPGAGRPPRRSAPPIGNREADQGMNWREKLRKLLVGRNASYLARGVGLNACAITRAATKGEMPRAPKAIKIARALGVPADWLFDDDQPWDDKYRRMCP